MEGDFSLADRCRPIGPSRGRRAGAPGAGGPGRRDLHRALPAADRGGKASRGAGHRLGAIPEGARADRAGARGVAGAAGDLRQAALLLRRRSAAQGRAAGPDAPRDRDLRHGGARLRPADRARSAIAGTATDRGRRRGRLAPGGGARARPRADARGRRRDRRRRDGDLRVAGRGRHGRVQGAGPADQVRPAARSAGPATTEYEMTGTPLVLLPGLLLDERLYAARSRRSAMSPRSGSAI